MAVGTCCHSQTVNLYQFIAAVTVQLLFYPAEQEGSKQSHGQIAHHFNGCGREVQVACTDGCTVCCKEVGEADDEHNRGVFYINNKVVADLGHNIAQSLGQNDVCHGLHMGHADCLCTFGLAGVNGDDAATYGFCHVSTGVNGYNHESCNPNAGELHCIVGEVGQTVVHENCLQDHGSTTENFYVKTHNESNELQYKALGQGIVFGVGNGIQYTANETDDAADSGCCQRQNQSIAHTYNVRAAVFRP